MGKMVQVMRSEQADDGINLTDCYYIHGEYASCSCDSCQVNFLMPNMNNIQPADKIKDSLTNEIIHVTRNTTKNIRALKAYDKRIQLSKERKTFAVTNDGSYFSPLTPPIFDYCS